MPHCPFCKKLLEREDFAKHIEAHLELERMAHPETSDEVESLPPCTHELRGDEGAEAEEEM